MVAAYAGWVPSVELLYWEGCPSHPRALAELRVALVELDRPDVEVAMVEIETETQAAEQGFVGSPTLRIAGVDVVAVPAGEPTGLTCRVYRRRDGRFAPTPDPDDLRDGLRRLLPARAQEVASR